MKMTESTEATKLARPPMDFEDGRLKARESVYLFGVCVLGLGTGAIGGLIAHASWPLLGGFRVVMMLFGMSVGLLGVLLCITIWGLATRSWGNHEYRLERIFEAYLESYNKMNGSEKTITHRQWDLIPDNTAHVLLVAIATHYRYEQGEATPWSLRQLDGACWLGTKRFGDVRDAERMRKALLEYGLVTDASERKAGRWTAQSYDDVVLHVIGK